MAANLIFKIFKNNKQKSPFFSLAFLLTNKFCTVVFLKSLGIFLDCLEIRKLKILCILDLNLAWVYSHHQRESGGGEDARERQRGLVKAQDSSRAPRLVHARARVCARSRWWQRRIFDFEKNRR